MKKHPKIEEIYPRFLRNEATAAELDYLFRYFETGGESELRRIIAADLGSSKEDEVADKNRSRHLDKLQAKINLKINGALETKVIAMPGKPSERHYFISPVFKVAVSLLLLAFVSFLAYQYLLRTPVAEIKPGGNYATLVTADGKKVDLKIIRPAKITKIQGVVITKTQDGQIVYTVQDGQQQMAPIWNSIVTPLGGKYRIRLSDGTIVILNSGSKLEFPVGFRGSERRVKLIGEAYFEVTKDPSKAFVVESGKGSTEVLGTKFNVSSYPEDGVVKTTLLEGKVRFSGQGDQHATAILKPGEQAVLKAGAVQVTQVNAEDFMAWKDNKFLFRNEKLAVVMRQLSRWYNIEVDYNSLPDRRLYINISADVNLSEVLRMVSVTSGLEFDVEGRRVSVIK